MKEKILEILLSTIMIIYTIGTSISAIFFWYQYASEDGFLKWIFIDSIIAFFKGLVWPFFIF